MKYSLRNNRQRGISLITVIVFSSIAIVFVIGLAQWGALHLKLIRQLDDRELAFSIAESGIEYYRWHLAHAPSDFQDGNVTPSASYLHDYFDKDGVHIGSFTLSITPPPVGSTLVTIVSEGRTDRNPALSRKLKVQMGVPSWAKFGVAADDVLRFGAGTEVYGEIRSNDGIRFDGIAHNLISSAKGTYDDPDHTGGMEFGVHTHTSPVDPLPPASLPNRPDVFLAGRQFPVPALDFAGLSADLSQLKTKAQSTDGRYFANSGSQGYNLVLKTDDTFDLYRVTAKVSPPSGCSQSTTGWGTWSVQIQTLLGNYQFPANGIVFLEDNIWVEGQIAGARLTVVSARFPENPSTNTSITVNNALRYSAYDGTDSIGLVAQQDVNVGLKSQDALQIDAALVAKNGRTGRFYYPSACGTGYVRNSLTLYGALTSAKRYGFAYTDGTGYVLRTINYDANLLYGPPPSWPLTTDQYVTLLWQEIF